MTKPELFIVDNADSEWKVRKYLSKYGELIQEEEAYSIKSLFINLFCIDDNMTCSLKKRIKFD